MFTYQEIEAVAQKLIDEFISDMTKELAAKAANGAPDWEIRYISGKPFGAATIINRLMGVLKKREEENDA